jgi:hypothetical protein
MSDQRPEVGDRSAVNTQLTSARLECSLIVPASGPFAAAFWMQTIGACQVGTSSAGSQRCLRSCMRAVVRSCCCTSCCTGLTLTRQGNSVILLSATPALLALASSSRSQCAMRTARAAACLAWEPLSAGFRWRPLLSVVIVTHFVTRSLASRRRERLLRRLSGAGLRPVMLQLGDRTDVSVDDRLAPRLLLRSGTQRARSAGSEPGADAGSAIVAVTVAVGKLAKSQLPRLLALEEPVDGGVQRSSRLCKLRGQGAEGLDLEPTPDLGQLPEQFTQVRHVRQNGIGVFVRLPHDALGFIAAENQSYWSVAASPLAIPRA